MSDEIQIDAIGLLCPLPVLRLRKVLQDLPDGSRVTLYADDPVAIIDIPHFCNESGHLFIGMSEAKDHQIYRLTKGTAAPRRVALSCASRRFGSAH